ncbi:putative transporter [compost metagenome]
MFAWESSKRIRANQYIDETGTKHYELFGPLFFGSVSNFNALFDIAGDPENITVDFKHSRVFDMSGIDALNKLTEKYQGADKKLQLMHLSDDCKRLLKNADKIIQVNIVEDPTYRVATER